MMTIRPSSAANLHKRAAVLPRTGKDGIVEPCKGLMGWASAHHVQLLTGSIIRKRERVTDEHHIPHVREKDPVVSGVKR